MGFLEALTLVFIVLKLTAVIDWSWWAVTAPMWAGYAAIAAIWLVFITFAFIAKLIFGGRK